MLEINFNNFRRVNGILSTHDAYVELYKDKKEFYLYCTISSADNLFFKISRYDLLNLLRKKIVMVELIEKVSYTQSIFKKIALLEEFSYKNFKQVDKKYISEMLTYFDSEHRYYEYVPHLEKKLNNKLRKDKIKNLFNG